jgi:hypothetical protein
MMPAGFVAYRGPSLIDGAPIAAIITLRSHNSKTGDMAQAWVLRSDMDPQAAIRDGHDTAICGDCMHRSGSSIGRSCYVITWLGPLNVYRSFTRGGYPDVAPDGAAGVLLDRQLRVCAYGDPAAVPFDVWFSLLSNVDGWTGYTHQWRTCDQRLKSLLMASVDTEDEQSTAAQMGWRTFRTRLSSESALPTEIVCPASNEAGHLTTCDQCNLCTGNARGRARSVVIAAHGQRVRWFELNRAALDAARPVVTVSVRRDVERSR